jgi:hypothetical protein
VWKTVKPDGTGGPRLAVTDEDGTKVLANSNDPDIRYPILKAEVPDDIHFVGFDLSAEQVRGHPDLAETAEARQRFGGNDLGWFFVIQEVPGEPRFGLDETPAPSATGPWWNNLSWTHVDAPDERLDPTRPLKTVPGTNPPGHRTRSAPRSRQSHALGAGARGSAASWRRRRRGSTRR